MSWCTRRRRNCILKNVLQRVRDTQLFVGLSKCELVTQGVQYLGSVIEPGGAGPDPEKVEAVNQWPVELLDRKQLRWFLGMVGYYRRLIPNFNNGLICCMNCCVKRVT